MTATTNSGVIDTQEFADKARKDLLLLLASVRGKKNLVIERSLAGTIGLFVKFSTLQEYGVDKLFLLENHNVDSSQKNVVFLTRGEDARKVRTVAEQIRLVRSESQISHDFTIIWVPRRTQVSDLILEEHAALGEATIHHLDLHFITLDHDLLSLELDDAFEKLVLRKDPTSIFASAKALMLLQKQYGLFPRILGKGDNAKRLADLLVRMRNEEDANDATDSHESFVDSFGMTVSNTVDNLIIIDRETDMPTVLATQLTYEGLIDEVFGVANNQTEVDSIIVDGVRPNQPSSTITTTTGTTKKKVILDTTDKMFPTLRDANFATIGPILNQTARRLLAEQENIRNKNRVKDSAFSDLQKIVSALPGLQAEQQSVRIHTNLAEEITKFTRSERFRQTLEVEQNLLAGGDATSIHENIDELIFRDAPLTTVLRLLCLESCSSNGIRQRDLDQFKRHLLQAYGCQHILTLANLEKMGLLVPRESHRGYLNPIAGTAGQSNTDWSAVRKTLCLWIDDVRESEPEDVAYVFSGAAPLSVRLVQAVLQKPYLLSLNSSTRGPKDGSSTTTAGNQGNNSGGGNSANTSTGWTNFTDTLSRIRGATVDVTQKGHDAEAGRARRALQGGKEGHKTTIIFYLGGITYAEIAALRFVSRRLQETNGRRLLIVTTAIVNGKKVVDVAIEKRTLTP